MHTRFSERQLSHGGIPEHYTIEVPVSLLQLLRQAHKRDAGNKELHNLVPTLRFDRLQAKHAVETLFFHDDWGPVLGLFTG
jgi:hypothetical protein